MTRKLEELFNLPPTTEEVEAAVPSIAENRTAIQTLDDAIDKIDAALPAVRGLESTDQEMDDLAKKATDSYDELMSLGMQVDSRFAAEIFSVASNMLGHAITAKTAKLDKKLKMIELQLKKQKLDNDSIQEDNSVSIPGDGFIVADRNSLLEKLRNMK